VGAFQGKFLWGVFVGGFGGEFMGGFRGGFSWGVFVGN